MHQVVLLSGCIKADKPYLVLILFLKGGGEDCADAKGHPCPEPDCNVVCDKAHKLKLHMLSHSVERPFKVKSWEQNFNCLSLLCLF